MHRHSIITNDFNLPMELMQDCLDTTLADLDTFVCVTALETSEMQAINLEHRGIDKATNVLAFKANLPAELAKLAALGDLLICPPIIMQQAKEQHKQYNHHLAHILIHGCLHLLDYDHINSNDSAIMEAKEVAILQKFNITNPYIESKPYA